MGAAANSVQGHLQDECLRQRGAHGNWSIKKEQKVDANIVYKKISIQVSRRLGRKLKGFSAALNRVSPQYPDCHKLPDIWCVECETQNCAKLQAPRNILQVQHPCSHKTAHQGLRVWQGYGGSDPGLAGTHFRHLVFLCRSPTVDEWSPQLLQIHHRLVALTTCTLCEEHLGFRNSVSVLQIWHW